MEPVRRAVERVDDPADRPEVTGRVLVRSFFGVDLMIRKPIQDRRDDDPLRLGMPADNLTPR